jgi:hypothetical protein
MATPRDALSGAQASWNAGDLDGYLELYDERIALHGYGPAPMSKDEVRGFYAAIFDAFGSPQLESTRCSGTARRRRSASR